MTENENQSPDTDPLDDCPDDAEVLEDISDALGVPAQEAQKLLSRFKESLKKMKTAVRREKAP